MAILTDNENEIEVSILRHADKTKFEEHVKIGDREKHGTNTCDRYIVSEPGCVYTVEVTLKKGYRFGRFGRFDGVMAQLYFGGTPLSVAHAELNKEQCIESDGDALAEDVSMNIESVSDCPENIGLGIAGARFQFRTLMPDEDLDNETDIVGVSPQDLGDVTVKVSHITWGGQRRLTRDEYDNQVAKTKRTMLPQQVAKTWDIQRVDATNFKKHGISTNTGFIGARPVSFQHSEVVDDWNIQEAFVFKFHCRNTEFLEALGIVPYPPPLYCYPWAQLTDSERKVALKKLQELNKDYVYDYPGHVIGNNRQRKEWRSWNLMQPYERKQEYEKLQAIKKRVDRGDVKQQVMEKLQFRPQDIIDLERIDSHTKANGNRSQRNTTKIKTEIIELDKDISRKRHRSHSSTTSIANTATIQNWPRRPLQKSAKIKQEPIDVDAIKDTVSDFRPAPTIKHDSPDPGNRIFKHVKFEGEDEVVDMSAIEDAKYTTVAEEDLRDEERKESERRSNELEEQTEAENELARQELAELLRLTGDDIAE